MSLRKKNGYWHYRFMLDGQRVEKSTDLEATKRNEQPAKDIEAARRLELIQERAGIITPSRIKTIGLIDAMDEWLDYSKATSVINTYKTRKTTAASAKEFFGNVPVKSITTGQIEKYITWRLTGTDEIAAVCKSTAHNNSIHLSVFFKWAIKRQYAITNPVQGADTPIGDSHREYVLTLDEEDNYFSYAAGSLYDVGRLMILQGCRPNEITKLAGSDVDLDNCKMTTGSKTDAGRDRELKLTPESHAILSMRKSKYGDGWLFPSPVRQDEHIGTLDHSHRRLVARIKMSPFVLYDFRHTFATRMIQAGIDIVTLMHILGHTNIRMTMRYVHLAQSQKDAAMDKYVEWGSKNLPTSPSILGKTH